ncbi:hypothetical protein [Paracoccus liaowanqingii]|uniref:hypothetical protein n=1 Tax=Paracoccus liaowanqingii TaxID=2560053 RepID=UPI00198234C6|nr:hypothetical protein [Paracoccus liaowanqingii]
MVHYERRKFILDDSEQARSAIGRLKTRGKPHKFVIVAIARRLATIADAILKSVIPWQTGPVI